jgi:hypothetical protein
VSVATEEGDFETVKTLVQQFHCQPSLFATQMAHINGHHSLVFFFFWLNRFSKRRNDTDISTIYKRLDKNTGMFNKWNTCIPLNFQF